MVNVMPKQLGKNVRMSFGKIPEVQDMPNLIDIQKSSYKWFREEGLGEVFRDFSATDYNGKLVLTFTDYRFDDQNLRYPTIAKAKEHQATYASPLKVKAQLLFTETGEIKETEIFMGDFPLMTESGTFVINGAERVIVSQLVRSPGVYYDMEKDKTGKELYKSTIIPNRGAWLEYEMDSNDVVYVRIDKNRKIALTTFLRAIGLGTAGEIEAMFGEDERLTATIASKKDPVTETKTDGTSKTLEECINDGLIETYKKLRPGEPATVENAKGHLNMLFFDPRRYDLCKFGRYKYNKKLGIASRLRDHFAAKPIVDPQTGEVYVEAGQRITGDMANAIQNAGIMEAYLTVEGREYTKDEVTGQTVSHTVEKTVKVVGNGMVDMAAYVDFDPKEIGINELVSYRVLRSILDETDPEQAARPIKERCEELAAVLVPNHITLDDIYASVSYFLNLCEGVGNTDDIDHLGNRRIRRVGELLQNTMRSGMARMERSIRERMNLQSQDMDVLTPAALVNIRPVTSQVKEFFCSSPLSQFMDQNNPLAELTHKRRLSALGPGGLSRDRAGFEVRDVHYSHYGRMCPIETPEGPNIGLISYLATFAKINSFGFIEAPYRRVDKATGIVTDEVVYMPADEEDNYIVAQANEPLTEEGRFARPRVNARYRDQILEVDNASVDFMDVSPKMVVSVATAMIPFLENDDANRALMGANMQRQAVPLLKTERPFVGTGMEYKAAVDSGVCVISDVDGVCTFVSADKIVVEDEQHIAHSYDLIKFQRSNQDTCVNQRPIVNVGDTIRKGQVLADGPATADGEISLGKNALIGFMTWEGYNYEDAVLLNERLVREDVFTSIHIEEYELECRDTKLGPEEITRDIPNVGDDALKNLDEHGIIRIGAEVTAGDILVGKVTPKGETELTAEERLLRAIFGEKAREVRDNSLKVPHGEGGIVIDVKSFKRGEKVPDNTGAEVSELGTGVNTLVRVYIAQKRKISVGDKMAGRHGNKGVVSRILPEEDMPFLEDGTPLDIVLNPLGVPSRMNIGQVLEVHLGMSAKALGWHIMTPVFDGAHEDDIRACFRQANERNAQHRGEGFDIGKMDKVIDPKSITMNEDGKFTLYDGRTGEKFDNRVTVGYMYYLKLHHLVDDKIHARSVGPYSLVTQQPLGGKAQFGGQRFGEMEVWALEAYGAAYTLQEILTVKSDDTVGRVNTYEHIVKGQNVPKPGIPESFKVLIKEMQSLGLDVKVLDTEGNEVDLKQKFDDDETYQGGSEYEQNYAKPQSEEELAENGYTSRNYGEERSLNDDEDDGGAAADSFADTSDPDMSEEDYVDDSYDANDRNNGLDSDWNDED